LAFYCQNDIPGRDDINAYYAFIIEKAIELLKVESIKKILKLSYDGLFVDEYQDCTISQHNIILALSEVLPTHILGDPMQGIFGFNEPLVNFETDLHHFEEIGQLDFPWRWYKEGNNKVLGDSLKDIRNILKSKNKSINLSDYKSAIETINISESDIYNANSLYREELNKLIIDGKDNQDLPSLLLIVPEYFEHGILRGSIVARSKLKAQIDFSNQLILLEAIDNKDYYSLAKTIDNLVYNIGSKRKKTKSLNQELFSKLFNKGNIDKWIIEDRIIRKRPPADILSKKLELLIKMFIDNPSIQAILDLMKFLKYDLKFKSKRNDLFFSLLKSMNIAIAESKSVYESMISHKNIIRRIGRKVHGKCLGTTLLTKGLEFDTVAILNAHRFEDYKHFYVAITRASKRLVIFTERHQLDFHN